MSYPARAEGLVNMVNISYNDNHYTTGTSTLLYENIPLTLYSKGFRKSCERVDVGYMWDMSWRWGQTATYWRKVLLVTIAALLPHLGWAAQPCVAEGPNPLFGAGSHSAGILSPTATATPGTDSNWLTQTD